MPSYLVQLEISSSMPAELYSHLRFSFHKPATLAYSCDFVSVPWLSNPIHRCCLIRSGFDIFEKRDDVESFIGSLSLWIVDSNIHLLNLKACFTVITHSVPCIPIFLYFLTLRCRHSLSELAIGHYDALVTSLFLRYCDLSFLRSGA